MYAKVPLLPFLKSFFHLHYGCVFLTIPAYETIHIFHISVRIIFSFSLVNHRTNVIPTIHHKDTITNDLGIWLDPP